jgi:hypothetical protein
LLGGYLAWQTLSFAQDAERATGEVVGYHETRDGDDTRYRPRVRFAPPAATSSRSPGSSPRLEAFPRGHAGAVVYKVSKPTERASRCSPTTG